METHFWPLEFKVLSFFAILLNKISPSVGFVSDQLKSPVLEIFHPNHSRERSHSQRSLSVEVRSIHFIVPAECHAPFWQANPKGKLWA